MLRRLHKDQPAAFAPTVVQLDGTLLGVLR